MATLLRKTEGHHGQAFLTNMRWEVASILRLSLSALIL